MNFIKCYVTQREKNQFFFNQPYLIKYAAAKTDAKKKEVPGCNYFKKIYVFKDSHCPHGAMFLEYLKGSCKDAHGKLCDFCTSREKCCSQIEHVPRPFPDHESPGYHYLPVNKTPTNNRVVDDYLPRLQLKKAYISGECSLEDPTSISNFSRQFIVSEKCVTDYLKHLKLLELRKDKRKKQRTAEAAAKAKKKYEDYNWNAMLSDSSLTKQTVAVLDKYLRHHKLQSASNKKAKLSAVQRHITHQSTATSQTGVKDKSDSDSGDEIESTSSLCDEDETDIVLAEIGSSSDEDDEVQAEGNDAEMTSGIVTTQTRSGRNATRFLLN